MRLLLLVLLVLNVAFFGWARWIDVPVRPAPPVATEAIPPLQLAGIVPAAPLPVVPATPAPTPTAGTGSLPPAPAPAPVAAASTAAPAPAASPLPGAASAAAAAARCRSVGPFEDAAAASTVIERLRSRGFAPRTRDAVSSTPNVYWVYIGEMTAQAQRRAIHTLNAAGIHDAASMTQPEQSDRLSVGVFSDQAHAVRRAEQVRALGFKPTLGMRQRTRTLHWIDFDVTSGATEPPESQIIGNASGHVPGMPQVRLTDCPSPGAD